MRTLTYALLAGAVVALAACSSSTTTGAASVESGPGWPTPLSEPKVTLSAPPAVHDYGPPAADAGHAAPGTDASIALAADAKAAQAAAAAK